MLVARPVAQNVHLAGGADARQTHHRNHDQQQHGNIGKQRASAIAVILLPRFLIVALQRLHERLVRRVIAVFLLLGELRFKLFLLLRKLLYRRGTLGFLAALDYRRFLDHDGLAGLNLRDFGVHITKLILELRRVLRFVLDGAVQVVLLDVRLVDRLHFRAAQLVRLVGGVHRQRLIVNEQPDDHREQEHDMKQVQADHRRKPYPQRGKKKLLARRRHLIHRVIALAGLSIKVVVHQSGHRKPSARQFRAFPARTYIIIS